MGKFNTQYEVYKTFCHTCLSIDRTLSPLGKYGDIYLKICGNLCKMSLPILICWECLAVLKKVKQFTEKVKRAQKTLQLNHVNKQTIPLTSISTLKVTTYTSTINITHDDSDDKLPIESIKEENDEEINHYEAHAPDTDDELLLNDVKTEVPKPEIKLETCDIKTKQKNIKRKVFKYVYDKISKEDLERWTKKIPIKMSEIKHWLDRERNSEVYKNSEFKCELCVCSWRTENAMLKHKRRFHELSCGTFICDICSRRFRRKQELCRHVPRHTWLLECGTCRHRSCVERHMTCHLAGHTRRLQCAACKVSNFSNKRQLYRHYKALHEVYICDHCAKRCKSKHMLEKHMRRHFEVYECKTCDRRYKTRATLRKHISTTHRTSATELSYCVSCNKQFSNESRYRRHLSSSAQHAAERDTRKVTNKVACPECGRVYSRKTYMMNHYRHVHMNQSKYYCELCDRYFLNRTRYVEHMRYKHEGVKKEKNKLCNICGRGFAAQRTLTNHLRTHSGERPFSCSHCGGKFTQKHAMLSHVKHVHLRSKRRPCWPQEAP